MVIIFTMGAEINEHEGTLKYITDNVYKKMVWIWYMKLRKFLYYWIFLRNLKQLTYHIALVHWWQSDALFLWYLWNMCPFDLLDMSLKF